MSARNDSQLEFWVDHHAHVHREKDKLNLTYVLSNCYLLRRSEKNINRMSIFILNGLVINKTKQVILLIPNIDRIIHVETFCINHSYSSLSYLKIVHFSLLVLFLFLSLSSITLHNLVWLTLAWNDDWTYCIPLHFLAFDIRKRDEWLEITPPYFWQKVNSIDLIFRWHKLGLHDISSIHFFYSALLIMTTLICQHCSRLPPPPPVFSLGPPPKILSIDIYCSSHLLSSSSIDPTKIKSSLASSFVLITLAILIGLLLSTGAIVLIK